MRSSVAAAVGALRVAALLSLAAIAGSAVAQETVYVNLPIKTFRCGVADRLKDFSEQNPDGEWFGFDVIVCNVLARDLGVSASIVAVKAGQETALLDRGEIDALVSYRSATLVARASVAWAWQGSAYRISRPYIRHTLDSNRYGFVVARRANSELLARVDSAIERFADSGDYRTAYLQSFQGVEPGAIKPWP